jgi:CubicO group peptidase (beta-lactamase class C family)
MPLGWMNMRLSPREAVTRYRAPAKLLIVGVLGIVCEMAVFPAESQAVSDNPQPVTASAIQDIADREFGGAQQAGGSAVVTVVKDGQILFMKGYGLAKPKTGVPVDPESTLYRIGSVSKLFTAITTLRLIERGVIDPKADINIYLAKAGVRIDDRFSEPVTMNDLLSLRAGRFDWTYSYYYPVHDDENARMPAGEISRRLWRTAEPGDVAAYDNNGVGLIGLVAQSASGILYRDLVRTNVLEPLGMSRSVAGIPRSRVPDMPGCDDSNPVTAYRTCPYDLITENMRPSGGMTVTAADMGKFMIALLAKGQTATSPMLAPATWNRFVDFGPSKLDPRLPTWGQIIYETYLGNRHAYGHDGGVGQFTTLMRLYPDSRIGIFVCVQRGLDWQHPPHIPKSLSEFLEDAPQSPPRSVRSSKPRRTLNSNSYAPLSPRGARSRAEPALR